MNCVVKKKTDWGAKTRAAGEHDHEPSSFRQSGLAIAWACLPLPLLYPSTNPRNCVGKNKRLQVIIITYIYFSNSCPVDEFWLHPVSTNVIDRQGKTSGTTFPGLTEIAPVTAVPSPTAQVQAAKASSASIRKKIVSPSPFSSVTPRFEPVHIYPQKCPDLYHPSWPQDLGPRRILRWYPYLDP